MSSACSIFIGGWHFLDDAADADFFSEASKLIIDNPSYLPKRIPNLNARSCNDTEPCLHRNLQASAVFLSALREIIGPADQDCKGLSG